MLACWRRQFALPPVRRESFKLASQVARLKAEVERLKARTASFFLYLCLASIESIVSSRLVIWLQAHCDMTRQCRPNGSKILRENVWDWAGMLSSQHVRA